MYVCMYDLGSSATYSSLSTEQAGVDVWPNVSLTRGELRLRLRMETMSSLCVLRSLKSFRLCLNPALKSADKSNYHKYQQQQQQQ